MTEYKLTHFSVGKYKKEAKMNAEITKGLQKAAKAKPKEVMATIANDKVVFGDKKKELILGNIAKLRKSTDNKVVVAATKVRTKQPGQIFAMKFSDEKKFNEFFDALNAVHKGEGMKKSEPTASLPDPKPAHSEQHARMPSAQPSRSKMSSPDLGSTTVSTKIAITDDDGSDSNTLSQKKKRTSTSLSCLRSGYTAPQSPVQKQSNPRAASYVTTDALKKHRHSRSPGRNGRVSAENIYQTNKKAAKKKGKNNFEMNTLKYVPGKGVVKSVKSNGYLYSTTKRSASINDSLSPTPSSSPLTSTTYSLMKAQHFRKVENRDTSRCSDDSSGGTSSSSSNSNYSLPSSVTVAEKVNVWKYHSRAASSSTSSSGVTKTNTLDEPIVRRQSRSGSPECARCPTCHQRIRYIVCRQ